MRHLEFTDNEIEEIWNLLAALLHLGNISFCEDLHECTDASKVKDTHRSELAYASNLLGVSLLNFVIIRKVGCRLYIFLFLPLRWVMFVWRKQ